MSEHRRGRHPDGGHREESDELPVLLPNLTPVKLSIAGGTHRPRQQHPQRNERHVREDRRQSASYRYGQDRPVLLQSHGEAHQSYHADDDALAGVVVGHCEFGAARLAEGANDWEEYVDEATGIPYYFDHATGDSSWEAPAAWRLLSNTVTAISRPVSKQQATRGSSAAGRVPQGSAATSPWADKSRLPSLAASFQNLPRGQITSASRNDKKSNRSSTPAKNVSGENSIHAASALDRFRAAAKKVTMAQRFFGPHAVRPINMSKLADYERDGNAVVDRDERNRYRRELGLLHPAVMQHYDDQKQKVLDRQAEVARLEAEAARLKEKLNDAHLEEKEKLRLRSIPGIVTVEYFFEHEMGNAPAQQQAARASTPRHITERKFSTLDEALASIPPKAKAVVSLGTGTYTFTDRPLIIDKDVTLTRTLGSWVRVEFKSPTRTPAAIAQLLRMTPPIRGAELSKGDALAREAADDEKLRKVPCIQLRHKRAQVQNLRVFSDIQCGVLLVAAATKISRCILTGGGIVVRTATNSSSAQAVLVSIEDNKLYSACDDGIVCEGQSTLCQVVGNWIQSADGYGMWIRFGASPSIRNNDITSGHGDGVGVWHPNSAPTLASNRIVKNEGNGLTIAKGAKPFVKDNEISKNGYAGVWVRERGRGIIEFNRLFGNGLGPIKAAVEDRCEVTLHRNQGIMSVIGRSYEESHKDAEDVGR